jgi:catechol 2,3-dioxygenase-like lactoylglutathione lyase family enzyme
MLPSRLHHSAYVSRDLEETRRFYEDVLGLPLVATWCEQDVLFGKLRTYCHVFFGLGDGSALAFFQFADPQDQAEFGPKMPESPFHHLALNVDAETQRTIEARIAAAGIDAPDTYVIDHGYCRSIYVKDPNGMIVEFAHDAPGLEAVNAGQARNAHADLARWLAGDRTPNNMFRAEVRGAA